MHNWRLLLLAFLAVLEPIASFTERNLVDGREQCCSRDSLLRDSHLAYGTRFTKIPEDRRLSRETQQDHRHEVRKEDPVINRASFDRRLVDLATERDIRRFFPEPTRFVRAELQREHVSDIRRERLSSSRDNRERRVRETHRPPLQDISRDMRERDVARVRYSREDVRQQERDTHELSRARTTRDGNRFARNLDTANRYRDSMESRRETRRTRDNSEERRIQEIRETRDVFQRTRADIARDGNTRAREDRRMTRERMEVRRARSESRLQVDNNKRERTSFERRARETVEERRSRTMDRVRESSQESRLNRGKKEERQVIYRRTVSDGLDERRMQRNERREYGQRSVSDRRDSRERRVAERRDVRDSDRERTDFRNMRRERADIRRNSRVEQRRVSGHNERAASENRRAESRRVDMEVRLRDTESREHRTADRIDIRDSRRDVRLTPTRFLEAQERVVSPNREHRLAKLMERDTRFRSNPELIITRETFTSIRKISEGQPSAMNWQNVFYTLQGIYLCGILMQLLTQKESDKKPRVLTWLSAPGSLVKVD